MKRHGKNGKTRREVLRIEAIRRRVAKAKRRVAKGLPITKKQEKLLEEHG